MRLAWCVVLAISTAAQQLPPTAISQTKFNTGQDVVPTFDGWMRNADGSFTFVFGYMNRNYQEEVAIAAGENNNVALGSSADQGQPTYFLPRRHAWVYRVKVPADWGQKELIWTITAHGRTEKAFASLQMEEEILPRLIMSHGNLSPGLDNPNKPPVISIPAVAQVTAGSAVAISAIVNDDGLPKPRVPKARTDAAPGTAQANTSARRRSGVSVSWFEYRGPAKVVFDPAEAMHVGAPGEPVVDGKAQVKARFTEPGVYVLRATADDGELSGDADVTVTVVR
jgi:hypothetical protein